MFPESDLNGQAGLMFDEPEWDSELFNEFDEREWYDEEGQYHGPTNVKELLQLTRRNHMAPRNRKLNRKKSRRNNKPVLIKCGKHLISPTDIRCISQVRNDLFIVKFYSDPNPEFPCWVEKKDIGTLLEHFEIIVGD